MKSRLLVVMSLTLMSDLLQSAIPPSCFRVYSVLICSKLNFRLEQIFSLVMYEVVIDFVFINNTRTPCNCKVIELVKMLRVTDVITVTMSPCTLGRLISCEVDPVVPNPVIVAGLVVSREDPRRRWAIKHHLRNIKFKIRSLERDDLRNFFYNSINEDALEGNRMLSLDAQQSAEEAKRIQPRIRYTTLKLTEPPTATVRTTTTTTTTTASRLPTTTTEVLTLRRRKRQTLFASVVPYLAFAGGEYYSLYDPEGIKLALPRRAQLPPLTRKSKAPKRNYPTSKPVAQGDTGALNKPIEIPTQARETYPSPAEIRRMTRESDHRMKSFIIFFVAITGIITVIAVLLIMAMRTTSDTRGKPRHCHASSQFCDQRRMEQECLLNDYEDTIHGRCPLFHYYQGAQQCPPNTCLMAQVMKQLPLAGPNEKATQTDGRCHPIIGGRHGVTEFPPDLNWSVKCGGQFIRDDDTTKGSAIQNKATLPGINQTDRNFNRPAGNVNNSSPLVSFLDSIVKEKDGVMREYHRDQFNVRRHRSELQYQPELHPHAPGSRRSSVLSGKKRQKSIVRTNSSSDTTEPEPRKTRSKE